MRKVNLITDGLLIWLIVVAGSLSLPAIGQSLSASTNRLAQDKEQPKYAEKLYLLTDQKRYFSGEQLWCTLVVTDAFQHRPSTLSKLAFVELLDTRGRIAWQTMVRLDSGRGQFSWTIPGSLVTGNYLLRAYTRWMRNQGPEAFFRTTIAILNPAKKPAAEAADKRLTTIWASPEGGKLVEDIPSRIHYYCPPCAQGEGRIQVMDDLGNALAGRNTPASPSGQLPLTPVAGRNYHIQWQSASGKTVRAEISSLPGDGITMESASLPTQGAELTLRKQTGLPAQAVTLTSHSRGQPVGTRTLQLDRDSLRVSVDRGMLREGLNQLTLSNAAGTVLASAVCYLEPKNVLPLSVSGLPQTAGKRSDITLQIALAPEAGKPYHAYVSARVLRVEDSLTLAAENLPDYLLFGSQAPLPGGSVRPKPDLGEALSAMQAITTGGPVPPATARPVSKPESPVLPDYSGPGIEVWVTDKRSGQPAAGREVMLTVPGTRFQAAMGKSGPDGIARFLLDQREGSGELVFSLVGADREQLVLTPVRPFDSSRSVFDQADPTFAPETIRAFTAELADAQLQQAIGESTKGPLQAWAPEDTTAFFGKPDREYALDDYVRFNTLEEVFREYIREVEVRKNRNDYRLLVVNLPMRSVFQEDPLVLVDGVPFRDMNQVMRIDPQKINRIAIVARRFQLGGLSFPGIISMRTYSGHMEGIELPQDLLIEDYAGMLAPYQYAFPTPDKGSRQPDLRRTLLWMPFQPRSSGSSTQVQFRTGDKSGRYALVVEALGADGRVSRQVHYFQVQ